jgi:TRAP-type C4-dicarboxylate transport system permease small subunit
MTFLNRDPFMQAYPLDIASGLFLGGTIIMIISAYNYNAPMVFIGELCVISSIFMMVGIAIGFNTGTHIRRF